jgi:hypothetical protein
MTDCVWPPAFGLQNDRRFIAAALARISCDMN